ncbi:MAG: hypothetical protein LUQ46_01885 [Candidatus Methanomethyliaceae archaeon]|nr:hypothetical protein [Candidatus Methanomethyliaceae archaeon]
MALTLGVKEIISEIIRIQQVLRNTSPNHRMSENEKRQVLAAIEKAEVTLKKMREEVISA